MKAGWIVGGVALAAAAVGGVALALRSGGSDGDSEGDGIDVPPKPKGLTKYDSEAFEYGRFVIVLDRRNPDKQPKKWRWRVFNAEKYGDGRELEGKQRASRYGLPSRAAAYRHAVRTIEEKAK